MPSSSCRAFGVGGGGGLGTELVNLAGAGGSGAATRPACTTSAAAMGSAALDEEALPCEAGTVGSALLLLSLVGSAVRPRSLAVLGGCENSRPI